MREDDDMMREKVARGVKQAMMVIPWKLAWAACFSCARRPCPCRPRPHSCCCCAGRPRVVVTGRKGGGIRGGGREGGIRG